MTVSRLGSTRALVGPPGLRWRGPWAADAQYVTRDAVAWNDSSYIFTELTSVVGAPPTGTLADAGDASILNPGWGLLALGAGTRPDIVTTSDPRLSDARTPTTHATTHAAGGTDVLTPEAIGAVATTALGAASGVATLGADSKIPSAQLPAIAITDTFPVATQAAMLALTAQVGDVAVRTDLNRSFILQAAGASTLANWQELLTPTDAVLSVNGQTGSVSLTAANVGAASATHAAQHASGGSDPITIAESQVTNLVADLASKYSPDNPPPVATGTRAFSMMMMGA